MNKTKILIRDRDTSSDASGSTGVITFTDNWVAQSYQYTFTGTTMTHLDMFTGYSYYYTGKAVIFNSDTVSNQSWWHTYADDFGSVYAIDEYPMSGFSDNIGFNQNNDIGLRVQTATSYLADAYQTTGNVKYDPNVKEILTDNPDADYISNAGGYCHIPLRPYGIIVSVVTSDAVVHTVNAEMDLGDAAVKTALDALSIGTWTVTSNATHMVLVSTAFVGCDSVNVVAYDGVSSPQELLYSDRIFFWPYAALSTLSLDGTATDFMANVGTGANAYSNNLIVRGSGKIVVGGNFTSWNGTSAGRLVQLNSDASLDATWTTNTGTGADSAVLNIAEQTADGKVLVAGVFTTWNSNSRTALVRLNANGTEDSAFYTNLGTSFNFSPYSVAVQSDGKILCGGPFISLNGNSRLRLVRLNSDGTEDTAFYTNMGTAFNDVVNFVKELQGGKILVVGRFTQFNGNTRNRVVLLNPNGTEDTTFYANCGSGFNAPVRGVYELSTGRLVFYGEFTSFNGASKGYIVELEQDGTLYTNFDTGTGFNTPIYNVSEQPDGNIIVGGPFTSFDGTAAHTVVRLYPDGSLDTSFTANITGNEVTVAVDATLPDIIILAEIGGTNFRIIHQYKPNRNKYYFYEDGYDYAYQAGVLTVGQSYSIDMDLTSITGSGDIVVYFGTTAVGSYSFVGGEPDGVRTFSGTADGTDLKIGISYNLNLTVGATASSTTGGFTTTFGNGVNWLETYQTVAVPITMQVADIREIEKRHGDRSLTLKLPGTKQNNKIFKEIWNPSINNIFDPRKKAEVQVMSDGIVVLEGYLQLLRTYRNGGLIDYEGVVFGNTSGIFEAMGNRLLSDLDMFEYTHERNETNIKASWTGDYTLGYYYPLVDYAFDFDYNDITTVGAPVTCEQMFPNTYARTYVDKIFEEAGYTYTSAFFDSDVFKSLTCFPSYPEAKRRVTYNVSLLAERNDNNGDRFWVYIKKYNPVTATITNVCMKHLYHTATFPTAPQVVTTGPILVEEGCEIYATISTEDDGYLFHQGSYIEGIYSDGGEGDFKVLLGDTYQNIADNTNALLKFDTIVTDPDSTFDPTPTNYNSTVPRVPFNSFTPAFSQRDFIIGLVKMFNLIIEPDRSNTYNLFIEPRDTYYDNSTVVRDWSKKLDVSKEIRTELMSELQNKTFVYSYTGDDDYYNKDYKDRYDEVFGTKRVTVENDFLNDETSVETTFSATPLTTIRKGSTTDQTDFIIPKIGELRDTTWTPITTNMRIGFAKYMELPTGESWYFGTNTVTEEFSYPYCGHFDDPYAPLLDLNYGVSQAYYLALGSLPEDNLYEVYYRRQMDEISSINSSLVTAYFKLTPADIFSIQFNDRIFFDGNYYRLNKIEAYDANSESTTKVELSRAIDINLPTGLGWTDLTVIR